MEGVAQPGGVLVGVDRAGLQQKAKRLGIGVADFGDGGDDLLGESGWSRNGW